MAARDEIELTEPTRAALSRSSSFASLDDKFSSRPSSLAPLPDLPSTPPPDTRSFGRRDSLAPHGGAEAEETGRRLRRLSMDEGEQGAAELPPVDKGKGAWGFAMAGFVLETFIWGFSYTFSTILIYLQSHEPWSSSSLAALSGIGTILLALMFMLPIACITLFRRYPEYVKFMLWGSAAVNCLSMLAASWAKKVWQLILLQGVLCGVSGAILYAPVLLWLNGWFLERRGLASGLVFSGTGFGGLVFPFVISGLLDNYGFPTMCRAWAAITAGVYALALVFLKPRIPLTKPRGPRTPWLTIHDFRFVREPVVLAMTATTFISSLGYMPVSLYLPVYTTSLASPGKATILVSMFNLAGSIGSSLTGYATDYSLTVSVAVMGLAGAVLALTAWGLASSLGAVFAFAMLFGMFSQICSCWGAAARDAAGANPHLSTMIFCVFGIFRGIASIVGPYISTSLYEEHLSEESSTYGRFGFRKVIVFVGCMSFLSAFGGPGLKWAKHVTQKRKEGLKG
ncbi:uncharacterized protein JCM10292_000606 [Rhodotorula paludigena]|uniref:uncharacterized protein n=1 Tax=Rhodotorula paludigena TaxID=86838 RepID=UPI0031738079